MRKLAYYVSLPFVIVAMGVLVELPGSFFYSLIRVFALPTTVLWIVSLFTEGRIRKFQAFHGLAALFILWNLASVYWSESVPESLWRVGRYAPMFLASLILWDLNRTRREVETTLQAFVIGGYVAIGSILSSYVTGNVTYDTNQRYSGLDFHPDDVALIITFAAPVAWYLGTSGQYTNKLLRALNIIYPAIMIVAIILTATRGAVVAAVPGLIYVLLSFRTLPRTARLVVPIVFVAVLALAIGKGLTPQMERLTASSSSASADKLSGRLDVWSAGLNEFSRHPILGVGAGAFPVATQTYGNLPKEPDGSGIIAHNTYISVLTETGVVGFALFFLMLLSLWRAAYMHVGPLRYALIAVLFTWSVGVFSLSFEFRWQSWLVFALAITSSAYERNEAISLDPAVMRSLRRTMLVAD